MERPVDMLMTPTERRAKYDPRITRQLQRKQNKQTKKYDIVRHYLEYKGIIKIKC